MNRTPNQSAALDAAISSCLQPEDPRRGPTERGRFAEERMKQIAVAFLLMLTVLLVGCGAPNVKYSDLRPATTATVSGDSVTVQLGGDVRSEERRVGKEGRFW